MIELRVLGCMELKAEDMLSSDEILRRPKRLALLIYLVLARRYGFHSRDELLALFWPNSDESRARTSLRQALQVLRDALGADVVLSRGRTEVAIDRTLLRCDAVDLLDRADAADHAGVCDAFTGQLAPGFVGAGLSMEFERWLDGERLRVRQRVLSSIGATIVRIASEEPARAIGLAHRAVEIDPADETTHQRLIRLLADSGDRVGAISAYERLLRYADEHLAAKPSPATYELVREVRRHHADVAIPLQGEAPRSPTAEAASLSSQTAERESRAMEGEAASRAHLTSRRLSLLALALVLTAFAGFWRATQRASPAPSGADPHRIAVLYFEDLSESQQLRHIAAGLTEGLIHELTQVARLQVVSAAGVRPWRDSKVPTDTVLRRFRAGTVVEGSVQGFGDSVRATIRLSSAESLTQLASRVVTVRRSELLELQSRLAQTTAHELRRALGESIEIRRLRDETTSAAGLEDVLRARQLREDAVGLAASSDPQDLRSLNERFSEADSLLLAAMRVAPRWPEPQLLSGWLALDRARLNTGVARVRAADQAMRTAAELTSRFPSRADAWELLGVAEWRRLLASPTDTTAQTRASRSEASLRRALALDSKLPDAWGTLALVLVFRGALAEAEAAALRALDEDAFYRSAADVMYQLGLGSLTHGDHTRARQWCSRGTKEFPQDFRFIDCELNLIRDEATRDPQRARVLERVANRLDPELRPGRADHSYNHIFRRMIVASAFAVSGQSDSARYLLAMSREEVRGDLERTVDLKFDEAYLQLQLGDTAAGVARLAEYIAARPNLADYIARDPLFRALRGRPDFRALTTSEVLGKR